MPKNIKIIRPLSNAVLAGLLASMLGCDSPTAPPNQNSAPTKISDGTKESQLYNSRLQELIAEYNSGDLEKKDKIINDLYGGRARLVPFSYKYHWKGSKEYGNVMVGIEGRIGVYYKDKARKKTLSEFELDNEPIGLTVCNNGIVCPSVFGKHNIKVPEGYSVLIVQNPIDNRHIEPMLWALGQFGKKYPDLGIAPRGVVSVREPLITLRNY